MLSQESIDLLEMMLFEKLMIIESANNMCDDCGRYNCLDDNCHGQWGDDREHQDHYSVNDGYEELYKEYND